ncbi:HAMP domain-containing histidine kinase [Geovibrio thiophilus]|uniref:histidine kinase n=1 Tax=Geovibrio thiophilus TaxID=139438 RepID=A0A3R5UVY7_9BACT|nr:HAMP domain-containing sensor histidine kinase [Geovibrio thiophilus]QAR31851.1 HAMP domain-containing histidine kinase [Geovibrio thiophilus]
MNCSAKTVTGICAALVILYAANIFCVHAVLSGYAGKRLAAETASAADMAADRISLTLKDIRSESLFIIESIAGQSEQSRAAVLSSFIQTKPEITEIVAADSEGFSWFTAGRAETPPIGADYSAEKSISAPLETKSTHTGQIRTDASDGSPYIEISAPLINPETDNTDGAVRIRISLGMLKDAAAAAVPEGMKTAVLIGKDGEMIAGDMSPSEKNMLTASARLSGGETHAFSPEEYIISYSKFNFDGNELTAAAYLPGGKVSALISPSLKSYAAASLAVFLLAVPFAVFIVRRYRSPYEKCGERMLETEKVLEPAFTEALKGKSGTEYTECFLDACEATVNSLRRVSEESGRCTAELVEKRTEHLKSEINELQRKLKEEYTKNTKKDQMMIRQSRLAAMGEMISNIAHQWRQPLNALALTIQDIEDSYRHNEINDDYIRDTVEKSMELILHMSVTIDDFRNFYKTNKDIMEFSLKRAIDEAMKIISASLKNSSIDIEIDCKHDVTAHGYPNEFSQVILNILSNSKDALIDNRPAGRLIKISIEKTPEGKGRIIITDNGGGIPANVIDSVFDPYFTTKEQGRGTGIGLYMSKTIIENNMGGKIDIANIGDGTKVTVEL